MIGYKSSWRSVGAFFFFFLRKHLASGNRLDIAEWVELGMGMGG